MNPTEPQELYDILFDTLKYYADGDFYTVDDPHEQMYIELLDKGEKAEKTLKILQEHREGQKDLLEVDKVKNTLMDIHKKIRCQS